MVEPEAVVIGTCAAGAGERAFAVHGLGSCVALVLFDPGAGAGGLAHALLPGPRPSGDLRTDLPAKYADEAVAALRAALREAGGDPRRSVAGVVGGARLFASESALESGVGARNAQGALAALAQAGLPVRWLEVGGTAGRTVRFDLPSGRLQVRTLREAWRDVAPLPEGPP